MMYALRTSSTLTLLLVSASLTLAQVPAPPPGEPSDPPAAGAAPEPAPQPDGGSSAGSGRPPATPDTPEIRSEILKDLYTHLAAAKDPDTAGAIAQKIEQMWFISGSDTVDLLMQRALAALAQQKHDLALKLLTAVTELRPDFAEGWNRRAFVYFRMDDTERSIGDLRRALALEPKHYKALEGLANVLREAGRKKSALEALRQVTTIHPHLPDITRAIEELSREVEGQGI